MCSFIKDIFYNPNLQSYEKAEKIENTVSCYRIKYDIIDEPKVSIIVVASSTQKDLLRCLNSIKAKNTYKNIEIYRYIKTATAILSAVISSQINHARIDDAVERAIKRVTQTSADQGLRQDACMARKAGI